MTADLITDQGETFRLFIMTSGFASLQRFKALINSRTIYLHQRVLVRKRD